MKKKKVNPADLDITPKEMGASNPKQNNQSDKNTIDKAITVRPTDQVNCFDTFICNQTVKCPITGSGCDTGTSCYTAGRICANTAYCIARTRQEDCITEYCVNETDLCGEATVDRPCIYTEQDTCENTVGIACAETLRNCGITYEDGCVTPVVTKEDCVVSEECALTVADCTVIQTLTCQESLECNESNVCEETSSGCEE